MDSSKLMHILTSLALYCPLTAKRCTRREVVVGGPVGIGTCLRATHHKLDETSDIEEVSPQQRDQQPSHKVCIIGRLIFRPYLNTVHYQGRRSIRFF